MSTVEFDETSSELGEPGAPKVDPADVGAAKPAQAAAGQPVHAALRGQIYTVMAREGVNAAEVINTAMRKREIGKTDPRRVEVIAPHGPSTSGGKKARQSITLAPVSGTGPSIMLGHLDVAQKTAELREYAVLAQQYRARFGSALEIGEADYQTLSKDLTGLLGTLGFRVAAAEESDEGGHVHDEELADFASGPSTSKLLLGAGVVVVLAVIALLLLR